MEKIISIFLRFTGKNYSTGYKIVSLLPGTIVFLVISPFFLFLFSRYLTRLIPLPWPETVEIAIALLAILLALTLMTWGTLSLWITGGGTPAPITPTSTLVTNRIYGYCRNPIELGTNLYFLALGTWLDTLSTGILCMGFGMLLGYGYIKIIEERELALRFGEEYQIYLKTTPLFFPIFRRQKENRGD